jgi:hypothetical protein
MSFDELLPMTLGDLDDASRRAVLERIVELKALALAIRPRDGVSTDNLTVDTPVPFSINKLWFDLHRLVNATHTAPPGSGQCEGTEALLTDDALRPIEPGDAMAVIPPKYRPQTSGGTNRIYLSAGGPNMRRPVETLASKLRDPQFAFLLRPGPWRPDLNGVPTEDLDTLMEQWIGGPKNVAILDLSGIPYSILTDIAGALLRILFDALFWSRNLSEGGRERPLLVVLEEAHAYLGSVDAGPAAAAVKRIVKEGRKYGIGAMIVSQRPAEIDSTILSQCGTIVAMRLSNSTDRSHVTSAVSDNLEGLLSMLPVLRTGEAIIVGEAVDLPVRALVDPPAKHRRPDSADPLVYDSAGPGGWNRPRETGDYGKVVRTWRCQDPRSTIGDRMVSEGEDHAMDRTQVTSTNVASVGYDGDSQVLEVEFNSGWVYQYFDVPPYEYEALRTSGSVGGYLNEHIKGHYRYTRL